MLIVSCGIFNIIFTRIVALLKFAAAVCAQASYVPDVLYGRSHTGDFEDPCDVAARELSEHSLRHLDAIYDLADNDEVLVLAAKDLATLELRSEDVLSHLIVAGNPSRSPSPGPY